ncbi:MAG: ribonuclease III [Clostridia bacterium]|nr:ribonuclease III [Clostridia bacterium]
MDYSKLEQELGYTFNNKLLLSQALTHTSYAYENKVESNEKLEFLGDAILEVIISKYLYKNYKNLREGEMTKVRATVVCEDSLYVIAKKHNFSDFLKLGRSEIVNNGKERPAILADSVEAIIAAIYLDSNIKNAETFILNNLKEAVETASKHVGMKDYKTVLQEKLQTNGTVHIEYITIDEQGPDHAKVFTVELKVNGKVITHGSGKSKKEAEMHAAQKALEMR